MSFNIVIKNTVSRLRSNHSRLKAKLGEIAFNARVKPLKSVIQREMKRRDMGAYEVGDWLIKTLKAKKAEKFHPVMGMAIAAAVYELIDEKADARIITR